MKHVFPRFPSPVSPGKAVLDLNPPYPQELLEL